MIVQSFFGLVLTPRLYLYFSVVLVLFWLSCVIFGIRANTNLLKLHCRKEPENIIPKKKIPHHHVFLHQRGVSIIFLLGVRKLSYSCVSLKKKKKNPDFEANQKPQFQNPQSSLQIPCNHREKRDKSPSLPSHHTTTNKRPQSDLVKSFPDSCYACHHHLLELLLQLVVLSLTFICATMISILPSVMKPQSNQSPLFRCHEVTHQPCLNPFSLFLNHQS